MHLLKGVLGACGPLDHVSVPSFYFFSLFELQIRHPTAISFYLNWTWAYHLRLSASAVFSLFYHLVIQTKNDHWALTMFWALEILSAENRPRNPAFTDLTFRLGSGWQRQTIKISLLIHKWCCLNEMKWRSMFNDERNQHLHLRKCSPIMKEHPKEKCSVFTLYKNSTTADREGLLCFALGQVILTGTRLAHQPIRSYHAVTSGAP